MQLCMAHSPGDGLAPLSAAEEPEATAVDSTSRMCSQVSWPPRPGSHSKGITKAPSPVHDKMVREHRTPDSGMLSTEACDELSGILSQEQNSEHYQYERN